MILGRGDVPPHGEGINAGKEWPPHEKGTGRKKRRHGESC
jgi:hypothetical protein